MLEFRSEKKADTYFRNMVMAAIPALLLALIYVVIVFALNGLGAREVIVTNTAVDRYVFTVVGAVSVTLLTGGYYWRTGKALQSFALALTTLWFLIGGPEDVFVYLFILKYPATLPWLDGTLYGWIGINYLGMEHVTGWWLITWSVAGTGVIAFVNWFIYRYECYVCGVKQVTGNAQSFAQDIIPGL